MVSEHRRPKGKRAVAIVTGALAVAVGANGALAQCVLSGNFALQNSAAFSTGTALQSIVSTIGVVNTSSVAQSSAFTGAAATNSPTYQGGIWVREVGGVVDSKAKSESAISTNARLFTNPVVGTGSDNCQVRTRTEYLGTQVGFDLARLNIGPATHIVLGMTAGYTEVNVKDQTPDERTFRGNFQVPFAGLYASYTSSGLSIDAQVRYDAYSALITDNRLRTFNSAIDSRNNTIFSQNLTANSVTFLGNIGYRFDLPSRWFIEPSLGVIWSKAEIDTLDTLGGRNYSNTATASSRVNFEDVETQLGRASVRLGTTFSTSGMIWQPFVVGSIFHEFAGNAKARAVGDFERFRFYDNQNGNRESGTSTVSVKTDRVGTYGHIGGGIAGLVLDSGWSGYARVDYREGENIRGYNFNIGGRYQFAADNKQSESLKDRAGHGPRGHNWSGLYLGVGGAGLFGNASWKEGIVAASNAGSPATDRDGNPLPGVVVPANTTVGGGQTSFDTSGALLGGQVGYNIHVGSTVLGAEAEWAWSNARGGASCPGIDSELYGRPDRAAALDCRADVRGLGMVTGRLGYTWDRALVYIKGGLAFGEIEGYSRFRRSERDYGESHWQAGWALGAGIEYALSNGWSIKGEYMHFDLGSETFTIDSATSSRTAGNRIPARVSTDGEVARVGINYRFGAN